MTYTPKTGDHVRIVIEDVVESDGGLYFEVAGIGFMADSEYIKSVEKINPPLPTEPGSVVKTPGTFYMLLVDGYWMDDVGGSWRPDFLIEKTNVEILFDAGKK